MNKLIYADPKLYEFKMRNIMRRIEQLGFHAYIWERPEPPWPGGVGAQTMIGEKLFIIEMDTRKAFDLADANALERYILFHLARMKR